MLMTSLLARLLQLAVAPFLAFAVMFLEKATLEARLPCSGTALI